LKDPPRKVIELVYAFHSHNILEEEFFILFFFRWKWR